jgi:hypothetical protein
MFKNKHFILAVIITPILAVIAYFGVDLAVSEKPHAAKKGESYKLISKSNCRYTSGLCDMENGEFKIKFRSESLSQQGWEISMTSKHALQGVIVSVVANESEQGQPIDMVANDTENRSWVATLPPPSSKDYLLRVATELDGALYYGDTTTEFVKYETLFTNK